METGKRFFADNIAIIGDSRSDPIAWNMNQGLHALAAHSEQLLQLLAHQQHQIRALAEEIRQLRTP